MDGGFWASLVAGFDATSLAKLTSLLVLPFAHEDLAIVAGAYIVVRDHLPAPLVLLTIYGGVIASDFAFYGIGAGARRLPMLNRFAIDPHIEPFADAIKRNTFGLVAICRLVPGLVFIAFVACGWMRVPLARFAIASLVISALYLPIMLYLVVVFGEAMDHRVGLWSWPLLLGVLVAASYARKRVFAFRGTDGPATLVSGETAAALTVKPS